MVRRAAYIRALLQCLSAFPVVVILGIRQIGKTTLARLVADEYGGPAHRLDLEDRCAATSA